MTFLFAIHSAEGAPAAPLYKNGENPLPAKRRRCGIVSRLVPWITWTLLASSAGSFLRAADAAILTAPARLYAGTSSTATLTVFDSITRKPSSAGFNLSLVSADGSQGWPLVSGGTGFGSQVRVEFAVPMLPPGNYKLEAKVNTIAQPLSVLTVMTNVPAILIETDKPIYKPSQVIQGRVVLLDNTLHPRAGQLELIFYDAKGIRIARQKLAADQFGAASFSLALAHELNLGTWKIRARGEGAESVQDVRVQDYVLPRYELKAEFPKNWALVDEPVRGVVTARYFFGKEVKGKVAVSAKRWIGTWSEYAKAEGTFSGGRWTFELPPVKFISGTLNAGGKGTITIDISATDSTGDTQSITEALTITEAAAILKVVPRSKSLKPKLPAELAITSEAPDGTPLSLPVETHTKFFSLGGSLLADLTSVVATVNGLGILQ
ncbi:MAG TPA: MG2 domain-containing protein, partial [Acidobacteriota bacterium]